MNMRQLFVMAGMVLVMSMADATDTPASSANKAAATAKSDIKSDTKSGTATKPGTATKSASSSSAATDQPSKVTATSSDQLLLDATTVTGNRELPKVMYIVPWKKANLSDLPGQPFNTLLDEALQPVDREVFKREVSYYQVISAKDQPETTSKSSTVEQSTPNTDSK